VVSDPLGASCAKLVIVIHPLVVARTAITLSSTSPPSSKVMMPMIRSLTRLLAQRLEDGHDSRCRAGHLFVPGAGMQQAKDSQGGVADAIELRCRFRDSFVL